MLRKAYLLHSVCCYHDSHEAREIAEKAREMNSEHHIIVAMNLLCEESTFTFRHLNDAEAFRAWLEEEPKKKVPVQAPVPDDWSLEA
jgi:hypothetical protein